VSRCRWQLRDAAVGYAARGIPVLPLHYPLPSRTSLQPVPGDPQPAVEWVGCSCRDPSCGQVGKHPVGSLVPHGVKDATTNRARILAWWTRHPQANIGLATGHRFDVLDVDGPAGEAAIRTLAATHGLHSSGLLVRTGGGGWHFYLAPTGLGNANPAGLAHVDWRGRGGYVVAPPSRHATGHPYQWTLGRDLDTPLAQVPAPLRARLERQSQVRPAGPVAIPDPGAAPGDRYARAALAEELARVATASVGHRNRQLWESTRNLYNLAATGALDHHEVDQALLAAADRCGLLAEEPRQTHRTLASGRRSAWPTPVAPVSPPAPNAPTPCRLVGRSASEPRRGGDGYARRRPDLIRGVGACRRQAEPAPTPTTRRKGACMGSHPALDDRELAAEALELDSDDCSHPHAVAHLAVEHAQVRSWPEGNPDLAHQLDHRDWNYDHQHRPAERTGEQAFDRLNPTFGVPADRADRIGHRDVAQREATLALGVRVAVHDSRQNDRNPVIWQPGQDYRMADAIQRARAQPTRSRYGPERLGPER
jgi:hypothetical protein